MPGSPLFMAALAALCVLALIWGWNLVTGDRPVTMDAVKNPRRTSPGGVPARLSAAAERVGTPMAPYLLRAMGGALREGVRRRIELAGRPGGLTVERYARQLAGNVVIFGGVGLFMLLSGQGLLGVALIVVGCLQLDVTLWGQGRTRQEQIQRTLPDFLDVLAVTVSAGLSFRHALERVVESMPGPLAEEMRVTLRQMEIGTPRREAFEDLRRRNDCDPLSSFVTAILQAEELGASLVQALADISIDMRRESAQFARRRAQRVEPRLTLVTAFVIMPAVLILLVGALAFGSAKELSNVFGG
ncbi:MULTISPECIES: type II secretion system F family protein [Thermomonosporaceae]|uniref:type II secretion system F family protein n=1 Tax=Thermomonosporaceae TaxID=2012 RepID=UPI00255B0DD0|nr:MULTISPECIES: type II secretion system F family protein [Thermomonosporaceae]MDL4772212.1 type II secretion system F family protein [Actinomadura xylanilytica]